MKICPLCNTTYEDWIDFCFSDGMPLLAKGGVSSPLPVKPSSVGATIAPQPAMGADLPTPSALSPKAPVAPPPAPAGRGDEVPEPPAPPAPPSDITGVFTGPITDDDGEEFRRAPVRQLNLADLPTGAPSSLPVPEADSESDEHSRATVPLSSSALGAEELASEGATTLASASVAAVPPPVEAAPDAPPVSPPAEAALPAPAETPPSADELEGAWHAAPAAVPEPEPEPSQVKKGGVGIGLLVGGVAAAAVLLVVVVGGAAMFMGWGAKPPAPAPAPVAVATPPPAPPPVAPPEPVLPPVDAAPVDPAAVDLAAVDPAAVPAPVAATAPPVAPTAAPVAAPAVAAAKPPATTTPPASVPVSKPPAASTPAPASSATADADPWGAPVAVTSGVLKIVTDPDGATVYINEQQRGKTPLTVELAYGVHNIRVVRSGYKTEVRDVTIRVAELNVPFILKPEVVTGQVNVYGPAGYRVVIDGHDRGAMPVTVQVSEGVRQFKLVSDADGSGCTLPKEIAFRSPGRPETVTLACP